MKLNLLKGTFKIDTIRYAILSNLSHDALFTQSAFTGHADHKLFLIKFTMNEYIRLKGVFLAKKTTYDMRKPGQDRKFLSKLIHMYHI